MHLYIENVKLFLEICCGFTVLRQRKNKLSTSAHLTRPRVQNRLFSKTFLDIKKQEHVRALLTRVLYPIYFKPYLQKQFLYRTVQCTTVLFKTVCLDYCLMVNISVHRV